VPVLNQRKVWALLSRGVLEVARVVERTYGPAGGKVMVEKNRSVLVTTDGAALTREAQLGGSKRLGAALVRSAAIETEKQVGDGTSTTVLLTGALVREIGKRAVALDWNPVETVREIREAFEVAEASIRSLSRETDRESLDRVARMASHGDSLVSEPVVDAVLAVGEEGSVVISPYEGTGIVLEQKEGLYLEQGWASFAMCPAGIEREFDGPLVVVFRKELRRVSDVASAMEAASQWPGRGLVVFAPKVYGEALATLLLNDREGVLSSAAVEYSGSPADTVDWLEDLATVTNATVVDPAIGFDVENFEAPWLGYARKITLKKDSTLLVSYMDEEILGKIDLRVASLKARAEASPYPYERDRLTERASALDGGLCTIRVGGFTKQEGQDRRSRVEDALRAVQTALRGGVVPGAGQAYFAASRDLPPTEGGRILGVALRSILGVLGRRGGTEPAILLSNRERYAEAFSSRWFGYDPVEKTWRDLYDAPRIVDPTEVAVVALRNAVSVACQIALCGAEMKSRKRR